MLALGSPKFDKIIELNKQNVSAPEEWNVNLKGKKCLLLNTTIEDFLESGNYIIDKLYSVLSDFEKNVLELYMSGKDYIAIAQMLDKPPKSIDNAIQRIRNKVDKITNL